MQKFGFVFPGQGSQKLGMLNGLAEQYPIIGQTFDEASQLIGKDLWEIAQHDSGNNLDQTQITQPVLLTASVAIWRLWQDQSATNPSILAGHSLGEYSALVCAGVLEFSDAVNLVRHRGEHMQQAVQPGQGAMAAIVGLDDHKIKEICSEVAQEQVVSAANYNSPGQTVIAGDTDAVTRAMQACKNAGAKRALPLKVSVPSHCALMREAAENLAILLDSVKFNPATIPVVQNVNAQIAVNADEIKQNLVQHLYMPVLWLDSINLIHKSGVNLLVECGPGRALCGLVKRIQPDIICFGSENSQSFTQAIDEVSV